MRILIVAMANSIHTVRWVNQIKDQGWDIHLFPVEDWGVHIEFKNITIHNFFCRKPFDLDKSVKIIGSWPFSRWSGIVRRVLKKIRPSMFERKLAELVSQLNPDIIHSLEIQHAGYLTLASRVYFIGKFPKWIVTNWGSDLFIFGQLSEHKERIKAVLSACDYYDCECQRDVDLALALGFKGKVLPVLPNTGGFKITQMHQFKQQGPSSARRLILLKGYQGWAGRALIGLKAIELITDELNGYNIAVYLADKEVILAAKQLSESTGIPIEIIPRCSHDEMLRLHGRAKMSIGLSMGDAASTSMLEAMVMGSFPIQSCTACADEWIKDGISGIIVKPEDPKLVAKAIKRVINDDVLVNKAAELNLNTARLRLDYNSVQKQVIENYEEVAKDLF